MCEKMSLLRSVKRRKTDIKVTLNADSVDSKEMLFMQTVEYQLSLTYIYTHAQLNSAPQLDSVT